jgi:hypothetical protein
MTQPSQDPVWLSRVTIAFLFSNLSGPLILLFCNVICSYASGGLWGNYVVNLNLLSCNDSKICVSKP